MLLTAGSLTFSVCFRINLDNSCLSLSRLEISERISPHSLMLTQFDVLGEDHRFLFLSCQHDKGFEYRYISVADLIDSFDCASGVVGLRRQILTVATEASVVLTPLLKKFPTAPEPDMPSAYFLSCSTCSDIAF